MVKTTICGTDLHILAGDVASCAPGRILGHEGVGVVDSVGGGVAATVLGAVLPTVVTVLLGFVAAWRHDFGPKDAPILNRMVLVYAVPLALFAGTVTTSRAQLSQDIPLVIALCVAIIGLYGAILLLCRWALRLPMNISALTAAAPAVPFVGPAILGDLFGSSSAIPIAIASLAINLAVVPVTILLLSLNTEEGGPPGRSLAAQQGEAAASRPGSQFSVLTAKLAETVKEPIVWAPVLGFLFVLAGLRIPQIIVHSLSMLGQASGGVALFASGIVLAAAPIKVNRRVLSGVFLKIILQPALVLLAMRWLGYRNPIVNEAVLTTAIPCMPIVIMFAVKYRIAESEAASAVLLSVIGSVITMGIFLLLTS
jgi:malonate transporter